jgi:hypothetical protein
MTQTATFRLDAPDYLMPHSYISPLGKPYHYLGEESGYLKDAIAQWNEDRNISGQQFGILKNYICHWAYAPYWKGGYMYALRADAMAILTVAQMEDWLNRAFKVGIKPW